LNFSDLKLIQPITRVLKEKGYESPTEIQAKAIPLVLQKKDVLGCAQTGTGKTASFALPMIQLIQKIEVEKGHSIKLRGLIVTPTRELALQIGENIQSYSKYTSVRHAVIFGGVKKPQQIREIKRGIHLLVATPGRLLDLISEGVFDLNDIKMFVLDEADRMLDMGFIHDIKKVIKLLPEKRQSLFFSATLPDNIIKLSNTILHNAVKIETARVSSSAETVEQQVYFTNKVTKKDLLLYLIKNAEEDRILVFGRTKHGSDKICRWLKKEGVDAMAIHGNKTQGQRQKALKRFKDKKLRVLMATDIVARGIDIQNLELVINFDVPNEPETYVHRIGRSGRAGNVGRAISISEPEENAYVKDIEKLIKKKIDVVDNHPYPQTDRPMTASEKKEFMKQKELRRKEFFANRKKNKSRYARR